MVYGRKDGGRRPEVYEGLLEVSWYKRWPGDAFRSDGRPGGAPTRNCVAHEVIARDLKKVSLAYEEGLYRVDRRTQRTGPLLGSAGPSALLGKAVTKVSQLLRRVDSVPGGNARRPCLSKIGQVALRVRVSSRPTRQSLRMRSAFPPRIILFSALVMFTWSRKSTGLSYPMSKQ